MSFKLSGLFFVTLLKAWSFVNLVLLLLLFLLLPPLHYLHHCLPLLLLFRMDVWAAATCAAPFPDAALLDPVKAVTSMLLPLAIFSSSTSFPLLPPPQQKRRYFNHLIAAQ